VPSPGGANTQRNVKHLNIANIHVSVGPSIIIEHYDGTTYEQLISVTLLPSDTLVLDSTGRWTHRDWQGAEYTYAGPPVATLGIANTLAETMPRELCAEVNSTIPTASGKLWLQLIYLYAGQVINNIAFMSATTGAVAPTNYRAGIFDYANRALLAQTADQLTTTWAANTLKIIPLTASYKVPYNGVYYLGLYMVAGTIITMKGGTARTGGQLAALAPVLCGDSSSGLTTALPNPASGISASASTLWAAVTS
jgi:hypothetical protein